MSKISLNTCLTTCEHVQTHFYMSKQIFTYPNTFLHVQTHAWTHLNTLEHICVHLKILYKFQICRCLNTFIVYACLNKFLHVWPHLYMTEQILTCLNTFICTCLYTFVHFNKIKHIWSKQNTFDQNRTHLNISEHIWKFLKTFQHFWTHLNMSEQICTCLNQLRYTISNQLRL